MKSNLLTSNEALEYLNLKDQNVIGFLVKRELLPRIVLGPRSFRYQIEDLDHLIERVKNEGLTLTEKP